MDVDVEVTGESAFEPTVEIKDEPNNDAEYLKASGSLGNSSNPVDTEDVVYLGTEVIIRYLQGMQLYQH